MFPGQSVAIQIHLGGPMVRTENVFKRIWFFVSKSMFSESISRDNLMKVF